MNAEARSSDTRIGARPDDGGERHRPDGNRGRRPESGWRGSPMTCRRDRCPPSAHARTVCTPRSASTGMTMCVCRRWIAIAATISAVAEPTKTPTRGPA